ncbi:MAG: dihydroorotate dehydrogenase electron transfer subunit [Thermodesulfobacteriota bacterium]|nr:dihydroorotate dehydrogenase electron transfer subunit [Thermodesulfobacteriota bacterium]
MNRQIAKVLWNRSITPVVFRLGLSCQTGYSHTVPGQFVMVRPVDQLSPLLGRPFSIYSLIKKNGQISGVELLIKVIGAGTDRLAKLKEGASVALLGPLGNGFGIHPDDSLYFLVAGGIGVAPLVFLAEKMIAKGVSTRQCEIFIGGRSSADLLGIDQFNTLNLPVHLVTEDGSTGEKGLVTSRVEQIIKIRRPDRVYACGPWAMLAVLADIVERHRIQCQVSIETMMGCGMGACLSCVVHTRDPSTPYRHACTDGPVMDTRLIKF